MKRKFLKGSIPFLFYFIIVSFSGNHSPHNHHALSNEREVGLKITYKVNVEGHLDSIKLKLIIPADIRNRQTVNSLSFSIEPDRIYSINSNTYAEFRFFDVDKSFKLVMKSNITIYKNISNKNDSALVDFTPHLVAEKSIESDDPKIQAVAATLKQKTDIETVMKTFQYVKDHIIYELKPDIGAEKVLESGLGKCMDFSDLFVALLRANQIPAKSIFGIVVDNYEGGNPLHAWSEAYLKKQGWVRFDATSGHSEITQVGKDYVMRIANKYVTLSEGRNDPELRLHMYRCRYWYGKGTTGSARVKYSFDMADL